MVSEAVQNTGLAGEAIVKIDLCSFVFGWHMSCNRKNHLFTFG
ncbi:hypothetical protein AGR13a_Cc320029 [Agrobacterium genomosp. 13 str. CFBP 6927]|uniref:Uncharacterized protein n=1 Tax=Agrobacterium genomosp. 13 str. CFBP 6927 TaxID=1183428 RepID=A0ABP2BKC3_9HYPH|nr:hypothetical protein AGR13a_Cc320029 [Agrobacterium genomosp. 13 str. CFBP 6927]